MFEWTFLVHKFIPTFYRFVSWEEFLPSNSKYLDLRSVYNRPPSLQAQLNLIEIRFSKIYSVPVNGVMTLWSVLVIWSNIDFPLFQASLAGTEAENGNSLCSKSWFKLHKLLLIKENSNNAIISCIYTKFLLISFKIAMDNYNVMTTNTYYIYLSI